jgi:hypothetical protein
VESGCASDGEEEILKEYIDGRQTGDDNRLNAAIGQLTADRSRDLTNSVDNLRVQLSLTVSDLRKTITTNTENVIKSSERLSQSNESNAKSMNRLTLGLLIVAIAQIASSLLLHFLEKSSVPHP